MGIGIFLLASDTVEKSLSTLIDMSVPIEFVSTAASIMIGVGSFVFVIGFCGCCGAIRESAIMLSIYIACMVVVMLGELGAGIYIAVEKGNIENSIRDGLGLSVRNYTGSGNATIDFMQVKFYCCGSENYTDYQRSFWFQEQLDTSQKYYVPRSCCAGKGRDATSFEPHSYSTCNSEALALHQAWSTFSELHPKGCYESLLQWLNDQSLIFIIVGVGIGVIERSAKKKKKQGRLSEIDKENMSVRMGMMSMPREKLMERKCGYRGRVSCSSGWSHSEMVVGRKVCIPTFARRKVKEPTKCITRHVRTRYLYKVTGLLIISRVMNSTQ
ncbi:hypothetical protein C0Q70_04616 [Pomacea canaliculata]|uniref:Uncharacterized protein n=1 Tax=Pomacea canaliculata TaxID=400727 RepID=A0A2T7PJ15_POMCA|nr:hypothetical protein C0Q70_04616 [Pomacea canaliculata]